MNLWDGLILLLVAASAALALRHIGRHKDAGGCGGDCASCACACNRRQKR
ncbi:MAG: FeoB-associated Cys-rich membrane protein [Clostridia bacterium]|nr:FeoB-associated Cys-rich membrane protein [Clostridia bacterium]